MADLSPREWLATLGPRLLNRRQTTALWRRYYDGDQDMPTGPQQHKDAYRQFQKFARTNLCKLAVDSMAQRMQVIGYLPGEGADRRDNDIWQIWQKNKLDSRQFSLYRSALTTGAAYVVLSKDPRQLDVPRTTIESAHNVIVATDPGDPMQRLAALRLWHDQYERRWMATLYLPGRRIGYQTAKHFHNESSGSPMLDWELSSWEVRFDEKSFENVPVIPFQNSDEAKEPRSEFDVGMDVQDRLNLTVLNRLTAERYAAFRQRFLMNYDPDYDPETGLPIPPFKPGADQTFVVPPPAPGEPEPKLGDLVQTDTHNILNAVEADMKVFAAITITPIYYLPSQLTNLSAEAIAALDAGHIAKIRERMASWAESWEEVISLQAEIAGLDIPDLNSAEVVWERPENFDLSSLADYTVKLRKAGYPLPLIAHYTGASPQEVDRLRAELSSEAFREALIKETAQAQQAPSESPNQGQEG